MSPDVAKGAFFLFFIATGALCMGILHKDPVESDRVYHWLFTGEFLPQREMTRAERIGYWAFKLFCYGVAGLGFLGGVSIIIAGGL